MFEKNNEPGEPMIRILDSFENPADPIQSLIDYARDQTEPTRIFLDNLPNPIPDTFPGYTLIKQIHRGGQGTVYEAMQHRGHRRVALKVLLDGALAGPAQQARFRREVQVLAQFQHPNIVRLYEGGAVEGRLYYAMDFVEGMPLDEYVLRAGRSLEDITRLLAKVADAVQAAHLKGFVHRDLKPGNIRVDAAGEPHLLDFGLAKLLHEQSELTSDRSITATGQFMGSLPWAAPEQVDGSPEGVDVRTDVYSLGVVLYYAITGRFPYDVVGSMRAIVENIVTCEPIRPSRMRSGVDDDVDTIVLKCLCKQRERRYQSAGELAEDLRRYLAGMPVTARRDNFWYVARRNVRRYWFATALVSFLVVLTLAYAITATVLVTQNAEARREQARLAEDSKAKFRLAHKTVQIVLQELATRFERTAGTSEARRAILQAAYASLKPLAEQQPDDSDLMLDFARTHFLLGDIAMHLGDNVDGRAHLLKALEIRRAVLATAEESPVEQLDDLSINLVRIGDGFKDVGDNATANSYYQESLAIDESLVEREPSNLHLWDNLGWSYERLASMARLQADFALAEQWLSQARVVFATLAEAEPANPLRHFGVSNVAQNLAILREKLGDTSDTEALLDQAVAAGERAAILEPNNSDFRRNLSIVLQSKARQLRMRGDFDGAWDLLNRAEESILFLHEKEPANPLHIVTLCTVWTSKADLARLREGWMGEKEYHTRIIALTADAFSRHGDHVVIVKKHYAALWTFASRSYREGEPQEVYGPMFAGALKLCRTAAARPDASYDVFSECGELLRVALPEDLRDLPASVHYAERAVELTGSRMPACLANLAEALVANGELDRAREVQQQALSLLPPCDSEIKSRILRAIPE